MRFTSVTLADLIMLDTRPTGRDEQLDYAEGIEAAGSAEAFIKNDLYDPERQMLGKEQEGWLHKRTATEQSPWRYLAGTGPAGAHG